MRDFPRARSRVPTIVVAVVGQSNSEVHRLTVNTASCTRAHARTEPLQTQSLNSPTASRVITPPVCAISRTLCRLVAEDLNKTRAACIDRRPLLPLQLRPHKRLRLAIHLECIRGEYCKYSMGQKNGLHAFGYIITPPEVNRFG